MASIEKATVANMTPMSATNSGSRKRGFGGDCMMLRYQSNIWNASGGGELCDRRSLENPLI